MKNYIKIIFAFCGVILAFGIAVAAFFIAKKPSADFQRKINYITEYEFYAENLKADMYRAALKDRIFSTNNLKDKINLTEKYFSNLVLLIDEQNSYESKQINFITYSDANKDLFKTLDIWRQEFELSGDSSAITFALSLKKFDKVRLCFEQLKTSYQDNFIKQEKDAKILSIILIISAWGIGVFLTWLVSSAIYSIFIERERSKKATLRLHLNPMSQIKENENTNTTPSFAMQNISPKVIKNENTKIDTLNNLEEEQHSINGYKNNFEDVNTKSTNNILNKKLNISNEQATTTMNDKHRNMYQHDAKKNITDIGLNNNSAINNDKNILSSENRKSYFEQSYNSESVQFTANSLSHFDNAEYVKLKQEYANLKIMYEELSDSKNQIEKKCNEFESSYSKLKDQQIFTGANREERIVQVKTFLENVQITVATAQEDAMIADELISTFNDGHALFKTTYEKILYINQSASKISEMSDVIANIAEQTKMLSMNAAIEAAHAGEYGKGFAVVAEELGRLASAALESSADIVKTINEVIKSIAFTAQSSKTLDEAFNNLKNKTNKMYSSVTEFSDKMVDTFRKTDGVLKLL